MTSAEMKVLANCALECSSFEIGRFTVKMDNFARWTVWSKETHHHHDCLIDALKAAIRQRNTEIAKAMLGTPKYTAGDGCRGMTDDEEKRDE